jgi:uncharacterized protein
MSHLTRRTFLTSSCAASALALTSTTFSAVPATQSSATRNSLSFTVEHQLCVGMIHRPANAKPGGMLPGVLMLHGLVSSKDQPHRIFVTLADRLARESILSYRFDLRGCGDSEGESIDRTPQSDLEDARHALQVLAGESEVDERNLTVLGFSWGGVLAALLADDPHIRRIVLWSSVPSDEPWAMPLKNVTGRECAELYGNLLGKEFFQGLERLRPRTALMQTKSRVHLFNGTADELCPAEKVQQLARDLEARSIKCQIAAIEGADHAFMTHAHESQLLDKTVAWLTT